MKIIGIKEVFKQNKLESHSSKLRNCGFVHSNACINILSSFYNSAATEFLFIYKIQFQSLLLRIPQIRENKV